MWPKTTSDHGGSPFVIGAWRTRNNRHALRHLCHTPTISTATKHESLKLDHNSAQWAQPRSADARVLSESIADPSQYDTGDDNDYATNCVNIPARLPASLPTQLILAVRFSDLSFRPDSIEEEAAGDTRGIVGHRPPKARKSHLQIRVGYPVEAAISSRP